MGGGGQLDGNFLSGSLPHKFIILIVTSFICLWSIIFFLSLVTTTATAAAAAAAVSKQISERRGLITSRLLGLMSGRFCPLILW